MSSHTRRQKTDWQTAMCVVSGILLLVPHTSVFFFGSLFLFFVFGFIDTQILFTCAWWTRFLKMHLFSSIHVWENIVRKISYTQGIGRKKMKKMKSRRCVQFQQRFVQWFEKFEYRSAKYWWRGREYLMMS